MIPYHYQFSNGYTLSVIVLNNAELEIAIIDSSTNRLLRFFDEDDSVKRIRHNELPKWLKLANELKYMKERRTFI